MSVANLTLSAKIPVTILTGFLGSGKTTVLSRLVKTQMLKRTAVIINEFGEIGLDHELVEKSDENFMLMRNGCVCCTVRGDLISTIGDLSVRQQRGDIEPLERVVIETTGLADPAPILHTLMNEQSLHDNFGLGAVVTTIDAVNGLNTLDNHQEAIKQIGVADLLLLTKTDVASQISLPLLRNRIASINPGAKIVQAVNGEFNPAVFFASGLYRPESKTADVQSWLNAEAYTDAHTHHTEHDHNGTHDNVGSRHGDQIKAHCIIRETPVSWTGFSAWLKMITAMRGNDLLRIKGIVNVAEHPSRPIVIHGVQHIFHPPVHLNEWPSDDHRTRIVFITKNIDRDTIEETLRVFERRAQRKRPM